MAVEANSTNMSAIIRPEDIGRLIIEPIDAQSIAAQVATVVETDSAEFRIPIVTDDPSAAWVEEGKDIPLSSMGSDEVTVRPSKLAGLVVISSELADDSNPAADQIVGDGLVRDIVRKLDAAFFGNLPAPAPHGLGYLLASGGVHPAIVNQATGDTSLDAFAEAISKAESVGSRVDNFVANPDDALDLARLKDEEGSNRPLLGLDAASPTKRQLQGVPLLVSPYVPRGLVWGIPKTRTFVVRRKDTRLDRSEHSHFGSDQIAIRATTRHGFGFPHIKALVAVNLSAG